MKKLNFKRENERLTGKTMSEVRNPDENRLNEGNEAEWERGIRDKLRASARICSGREPKPEGKQWRKKIMRISGDREKMSHGKSRRNSRKGEILADDGRSRTWRISCWFGRRSSATGDRIREWILSSQTKRSNLLPGVSRRS
jgi:hypothetical protein